jgi:hypothetical protein
MQNDCPEDRFLRDVSDHVMTVLRDDGVYRHLRFRKPDSSDMYFDLITWPGYLCYTGDMGTYVFSRLTDMFQFFRTPESCRRSAGNSLYVNLGYWAEKLEASEPGGVLKFSQSRFHACVLEYMDEAEVSDDIRERVMDEILSFEDESEDLARQRVREFNDERLFPDFWENDFREYVFRFKWCCYALSWAINVYDAQGPSPLAVEGT